MTVKVGPKGQVVIPKQIRERLKIRPGDRVVVREEAGAAVVRRAHNQGKLWGIISHLEGDPLGALAAEHRSEIERDEKRREALER